MNFLSLRFIIKKNRAKNTKRLLTDRLQSLVTENILNDIEKSNIVVAAVLVTQSGRALLDGSYGYSDAESKTPLSSCFLFRPASMTNLSTAELAKNISENLPKESTSLTSVRALGVPSPRF